jgi:hypothetical protein
LGSYLKLEQMRRRCLQTRLYPYQSTIHFFQTNTGWDGTTKDGVIL